MVQYKKHKKAIKKINNLIDNANNSLVIHYSCESFKDKEDGRTPRITTIAVRYLDSGQTLSFSIHETAEQEGITIDKIEEKYNVLERKMLDNYFEFVNTHSNYNWIHWNMRDSNYGFYAIENRYKVLRGKPIQIHNDKKFDLARLMVDCYGRNYIGHSHMEALAKLNKMTLKDFLSGKDEAEAFDNKEYIKLRRSTLRKVDLFSSFINEVAEGTLKTNAKWKDKYGLSIQSIYLVVKEHWLFNLVAFVIGIMLGIFGTKLLG